MTDYKHPEVLVTTQWAADRLNDPKVRLVEVDVDTSAYDQGHIPGAVGWNWQSQLQDNIRRDLIDKPALEKLLGASGISNDTTILLYGDNNNWFAAYAFWQVKYYGHKDVRLINDPSRQRGKVGRRERRAGPQGREERDEQRLRPDDRRPRPKARHASSPLGRVRTSPWAPPGPRNRR